MRGTQGNHVTFHLNWNTFKNKGATQDIGIIKGNRNRKSIRFPGGRLGVDMKISDMDTQFERNCMISKDS